MVVSSPITYTYKRDAHTCMYKYIHVHQGSYGRELTFHWIIRKGAHISLLR